MTTLTRSTVLIFTIGLVPELAEARDFRDAQIPNGTLLGCGSCHVNPSGRGTRNAFGQQVENNLIGGSLESADVDWAAIYNLDADGDGYSNGLELGDPNGNWSEGQANPPGGGTYPGDANDTPCGNGTIDGPELCDSDKLQGRTCQDEGFFGGTIACAADCKSYDTSGCNNCGNGTLDPEEDCEDGEVGSATCVSEGLDGGTLSCGTDCKYDLTECVGCGNGRIEGDETCDVVDFGPATCVSEGFFGGTLSCSASCSIDTANCTLCGNGTRDGDEQCDGTDLGGASCADVGLADATLVCAADCTPDYLACDLVPTNDGDGDGGKSGCSLSADAARNGAGLGALFLLALARVVSRRRHARTR